MTDGYGGLLGVMRLLAGQMTFGSGRARCAKTGRGTRGYVWEGVG